MKFYYSPGACSMASHIALNETGLRYSAEAVDLKTHKYNGGDFYQVNPKGYVPVLETDNGQKLTENAVLLQYIADQKPESNLMPKPGTFERYKALEWLNFMATEVHKGFGPLWDPTSPQETKKSATEKLFKRFDFVSKHLENNQFMLGSSFSIVDCYLFTLLGWTHFHKLDITKYKPLMAYMERVKSRPAVMSAMKEEGLLQ